MSKNVNLKIAIYPGSFDPMTNGHLDIIQRGLCIFDKLIIGVAQNSRKKTMFNLTDRKKMIREVLKNENRIEVEEFEGLTVDYAKERGACAILRGLRAVADFEYELQMANMNRKLNTDLDTVFMMTSEKAFFVSSQNVKEVATFGADVSALVPPHINTILKEKFSKRYNPA